MAILIYAQPDDLTPLWLTAAAVPADAIRYMRAASSLVEDATKLDRYEVDADGYPTDDHVADAFCDAVCQQATEWIRGGIDPDAGAAGQGHIIGSQSVDGASVSYVTGDSQKQQQAAVEAISPAALRILRNRGLANSMPGFA